MVLLIHLPHADSILKFLCKGCRVSSWCFASRQSATSASRSSGYRRQEQSTGQPYCGWRTSQESFKTQTTETSYLNSERCVCVSVYVFCGGLLSKNNINFCMLYDPPTLPSWAGKYPPEFHGVVITSVTRLRISLNVSWLLVWFSPPYETSFAVPIISGFTSYPVGSANCCALPDFL